MGWRRLLVLGLPLAMLLMSAEANRIVHAGGKDRLASGTAAGLYGRSRRQILQAYGEPVLVKCADFDWHRYTKDRVVVMVRYGESDTADRVVVTDLRADPGAEGDSQCYPPFPTRAAPAEPRQR